MEMTILRLSFYFAGYAKKQFISRKIGQNIMVACINIQIRIMFDNVLIMFFVGFWFYIFCYHIVFLLLPFGFICYPSPVPPWLWTYSSVVRFCQTTFATARTTFVNVHTPRLKRVFLREWWGASRNFGEGSGDSKTIEGQRVFCVLLYSVR